MTRILFILVLHVFLVGAGYSQCNPPTLLEVTSRSKDSISISWSYFSVAKGWELALYPYGENPDIEPQTPIITEKNHTFKDLEAGTSYAIYLRTVCTDGIYSSWTLIQSSTVIGNPSRCGLNLPITNNNCSRPMQEFLIEVEGQEGVLGSSVFLERVEIIAEHTWPADLKISLESPSGKETILSEHHGVGNDDYGDIQDTMCLGTAGFSDLACTDIASAKPPFIGTFKPDQALRSLDDGSSPNGIWKLKMCDRSIPDIGFLRFVKLTLSPLQCPLPQDFVIEDIDGTTTRIKWSDFEGCNVIELRLLPKGGSPDDEIRFSVDCSTESFEIANLAPDTEYDLYVLSDCFTSKSPESCPLFLQTLCQESAHTMDFDALPICEQSCSAVCSFEGIFTNVSTGDTQDWLIQKEATQTLGTGPSSDALQSGNYAYVEASPDICGSNNKAILRSTCMKVESAATCGLSFYYHMFGGDVGDLYVLAYANNATEPDTLFRKSKASIDAWQKVTLELNAYVDQTIVLEFVAQVGTGERGDIAIDEIKLTGVTAREGAYTYYQDIDLDGYGNDTLRIDICASTAPTGYSDKKGDCDDSDPNIHPDAMEIPCNGIDENCNGMEDDANTENPILMTLTVEDESCSNKADGNIILQVSGGTEPYSYLWSDGSTEKDLRSVKSGYYRVKVTDANGCLTFSDFAQIKAQSTINIFTTGLVHPSCKGIDDGQIEIRATGGIMPYTYLWSDGSTASTISGKSGGKYTVTVSDAQGCSVGSDTIILTPKNKVKLATVDIWHPQCHGSNDGRIHVDVVNATDTILYTWDDGSEGLIRQELGAGNYTVKAENQEGCFDTLTLVLNNPDSLHLVIDSKENNSCYGDQEGLIKVSAMGGTAPYTYLWSDGSTSDDIYGLKAGTYSLTVTDANVCKYTLDNVDITQPALLTHTILENTASECILSKNGRLIVDINGGVPPYLYHWDGLEDQRDSLLDITSGKYTLTLIDQNQCKLKVENIEVESTDRPIQIDIAIDDTNTCFNDSLSSIIATINRGHFPIDYNWSHGIQHITSSLQDSVLNLPPDSYALTVTDAQGCVGKVENIELERFVPIRVEHTVAHNTCYDGKSGSIKLNPSGGSPPYDIRWSDDAIGADRDKLPIGFYTPIITDTKRCAYSPAPIEIQAPEEINSEAIITPSGTSNSMGAIKIEVRGGIQPYTIEWLGDVMTDADNNAIQLAKGFYQVSITDANECVKIIEYFVPMSTSSIDVDNKRIRIFPNPSNDRIRIESEEPIHKVEIYTPLGQNIKTIETIDTNLELDALPRGAYILILTTETKRYIRKHIAY